MRDNYKNIKLYRLLGFLLIGFLFSSCDGGDYAYFVNHTNDTIHITVRKSFQKNLDSLEIQFFKMKEFDMRHFYDKDENNQPYVFNVKYDSIDNSVSFQLPPNKEFFYGVTWLSSRDSYMSWEFNELEIRFNDGYIFAKNEGIPNLARKETPIFGYPKFYIDIGEKD